MPLFERFPGNPVLEPNHADSWEATATFNPCVAPCVTGPSDVVHMVYRAQSTPQRVAGHEIELSTVGHAVSRGGGHFHARRLLIWPRYDWERFGCEDPRVTLFEGTYYIFYTALSKYPFEPDGIRVGVAKTQDFHSLRKHPVTTFNAKAMALFPERIGGRMAAILTVDTDRPPARIAVALFDREDQIWSPDFWDEWYDSLENHTLDLEEPPGDHVEVGAPPLLTEHGWLVIYCYIRDYGHPDRLFGVEALLLDRNDPTRIVGKAHRPLLCPEEPYERFGRVPETIFPSGARIHGDRLEVYYGAADTSCCLATCDLGRLIQELKTESLQLDRFKDNPIIPPDPAHAWESFATFNAGAIQVRGQVHIVYRAMGEERVSVLGYASSMDGLHIEERLPEPVYVPREAFEKPAVPGVGSGCEDPRLTLLDDTIYMCYTAYDGVNPPRVALSSIGLADFLARRWRWSEPRLISRPGEMNKDAAIFPRRIDGRYAILHRSGHSIWIDFVDDLEFRNGAWLGGTILLDPPEGAPKIGAGGPPIETEAGWLLLYHGMSSRPARHYHLKAAILDLEEPTRVVANMSYPFLEPHMLYERVGPVPNVVFSCGQAVLDDRLFVYYGGADRVLAVASEDFSEFVEDILRHHRIRS
jgi:beta-1,2-mannobiose phosphorylase / 1,2-beta-oligomannan phosphorylase